MAQSPARCEKAEGKIEMQRQLTWRARFDEKSLNYRINKMLPVSDLPRKSMRWSCPVYFDQFEEPSCTGFATIHAAISEPYPIIGLSPTHASYLYQRAKELDQWPGEDYEGSSVLGAISAAKEFGYFLEYGWCFNENEVNAAVCYAGPVIMGTNWTTGMMEPDSNGIIYPTGESLGGHAYPILGYDAKTGLYRIHNSWGISFGDIGDCYIHCDDLAKLMKDGAEACIPLRKSGT